MPAHLRLTGFRRACWQPSIKRTGAGASWRSRLLPGLFIARVQAALCAAPAPREMGSVFRTAHVNARVFHGMKKLSAQLTPRFRRIASAAITMSGAKYFASDRVSP
jgi:hypothetical protein